jgi:hypothetical protein
MRVEYVRVRRAQVFQYPALHLQDLLAGLDQGLLKAADFVGNIIFGQIAPGDDVAGAMQNENIPTANARRNSDAAIRPFSLLLPLGHSREISKIAGLEKQLRQK